MAYHIELSKTCRYNLTKDRCPSNRNHRQWRAYRHFNKPKLQAPSIHSRSKPQGEHLITLEYLTCLQLVHGPQSTQTDNASTIFRANNAFLEVKLDFSALPIIRRTEIRLQVHLSIFITTNLWGGMFLVHACLSMDYTDS